MNPTAIVYAVQIMQALPGLIQAGIEVTALVQSSASKLREFNEEAREPTPAEWDELNAEIARLRGELHAG